MKISKNLLLLGLFSIAIVTSVISCKDKDDDEDLIGNWKELTDFIGDARYQAVSFTIGETVYIGTGYNGEDRLKDFISYNAQTGDWDICALPPEGFAPRINGIAFAAAGKGYVGFGMDQNNELGDLWMYDPVADSWTNIVAAGGPSPRYGAVAFSIGDKGYVGTGYDGNYLSDFYKFDPTNNTWSEIDYCPFKVRDAVAFVIDGKAYVTTGEKNGISVDNCAMYDPSTEDWTSKRAIADVSDESYDDDYSIVRRQGVAFVIGDKAYVTLGNNNNSLKKDCWEYNPDTDLWTDRTSFEGSGRNDAVGFSTESGRGFVTTGNGSTGYFDDFWEFKPTETLNEDD